MKKIWEGLWSDSTSLISLLWIGVIVLSSVLAYVFSPVKTSFANEMIPELALVPPGTEQKIFLERQSGHNGNIHSAFFGKSIPEKLIPVSQVKENKETSSFLPMGKQDIPENWQIASAESQFLDRTFWLGADKYGRDYLSRLIIGSRISISVGLIAVLISLLAGIPLGALAGFYGGRIDAAIQWILQVVWSIPTLLLVIALTLALGKGFWQVFIAIGLTMWVEVARVVRGEVMSQSKREYVDAARVQGFSPFYILRKHVLPNSLSPLIVVSAANFAAAILIESGLTFLGLGAQPPVPSWGGMIKEHYGYILMGKSWLALAPGVLIMITVLSFMSIGNRLRDLLDVRTA